MRKILLAFSGGIDSCAAVDILRSGGYVVVLATIDMIGDESLIAQARVRAEELGCELHIIDGRELFERSIIDNFIGEYLSGRTPAPCTRCNTDIKWRLIAYKATELGIEQIATGHYFQITQHNGRHYVTRAVDPQKDQSYYLWGVREEVLARAVTPLGDRIKAEVKAQSNRVRESMGVCFLGGRHYAEFLCSRCGEMKGGDIVDRRGEIVGRHNGIARYTIGQRRGEGIPEGLRVLDINAERDEIVVGENHELYTSTLHIESCYFVDPDEVTSTDKLTVMVRGIGRNPEGYARLALRDYGAEITLDGEAWAVASGQPIVLYIGDRVVGGGYLR